MARNKMTDAEILKANAEALLAEQQQVLAHAGSVVRQASRELGRYAQDEVYPRVAASTRQAARGAREKLVDDVLPSVAAVIGSTMSVIDAARDQRFKNVTKAVTAVAAKSRKAAPRCGILRRRRKVRRDGSRRCCSHWHWLRRVADLPR